METRHLTAQSSAALLAAVMRDEPKPLNELRRDVPPEVRQIVKRCLKKIRRRVTLPALNWPRTSRIVATSCSRSPAPRSAPARIIREVRRPRMLVPILLAILLIAVRSRLVGEAFP